MAALSQALGCVEAAAPPALVNGGFQLPVRDGLPPGWTVEQAAKDKGRLDVRAGLPGAAGPALLLLPNARNRGDKLLGAGQVVQAKAWRGQTLVLRALMAAEGGASAIVGLHALGPAGDLGHVQLRQGDNGGKLLAQEQVLQVPNGADLLVLYVATDSTAGAAAFDELTLGPAPASAPRSTPAAARAPAAERVQVEVDVRQVLRQIPPTLYGTNAEWIFDGQGLWSTPQNRLDPEALRQVAELAPTVIRFPGGVFSDTYRWRDGVGPAGTRPTTENYPGGPKSRHAVGTLEIAEIARRAGGELLITVNAGSGSAREAADWVRFARAEVSPRVRLWEVGNELYMKGDLSGHTLTASQYSARFLEYAAAMRAADPDIRIAAIGGLNRGNYRFVADDRWTEHLLKQAAGQIDMLAVHNAYAPLVIGVSERTDPRQVYLAMLAAPQEIEANLKEVSRLIARHETPGRPISIAVTEWGPSFHVLPGSPWVDHVKTMGSALFVASTLNAFLRTPRLEVANFFKLTDLGFMGWIGRRQDRWVQTAPAMAFAMYRHQLGRNLVATQIESPSFDSPGVGAMARVSRAPWVDGVSTFDAGRLVLMLVNRSDTTAMATRLQLQGVSSYAAGQVHTLAADSLDAHTGTELPRIPGLAWARQIELSRFSKGAPGEVRSTTASLAALRAAPAQGAAVDLQLPPLSITAITLSGVSLR